MKKGILVICVAVVVLAMVMAAAAKETTKVETPKKVEPKNDGGKDTDKGSYPKGQPFEEIWKAIKDLQDKLNSGVTRDEFDALKERVDALEGRVVDLETLVDALEGRVDVLEARIAVLEDCDPVSETCNGIDDDCDGVADDGSDLCTEGSSCNGYEGCVPDQVCNDIDGDGDGFKPCNGGDCNDNDPAINPKAPEVCDGVDNDCDAMTDEGNDLCESGFVCNTGQCIPEVCTPACGAASPVCENGLCKLNCAGYDNCLGPCSTDSSGLCAAQCLAHVSTGGLDDYNERLNCQNECNPNLPSYDACLSACEAYCGS